MSRIKANWVLLTVCTTFIFGAALGQTRPATAPRIDHIPTTPLDPKLPTLWIIGDSTVRNGQDTGNNGQWGWGNPIASYFDLSKMNVQNWALGGTSSRTFQTMGRWDHVLSMIKPGDFLIMQFGHNDSGAVNDNSRARASLQGNGEETQEIDNQLTGKHEIVHTYGWYVRKYITDARDKGATMIIVCSPIPRNRWADGKVQRNTTYTDWAQQAAKQEHAEFINLNEIVSQKYDAMGQDKVTAEMFPENETVHPDWAGANLNAQSVVDAIKATPNCPITQYVKSEAPTDLKPPTGKAR
jgi:lysophospholipase L1-like esterase